jgi:hypothetical protein
MMPYIEIIFGCFLFFYFITGIFLGIREHRCELVEYTGFNRLTVFFQIFLLGFCWALYGLLILFITWFGIKMGRGLSKTEVQPIKRDLPA